MHKWEYCAVYVTLYNDGRGGGMQELLEVKMPGQQRQSVQNPFGSLGLLNGLGSEGWELVEVQGNSYFLKRSLKA